MEQYLSSCEDYSELFTESLFSPLHPLYPSSRIGLLRSTAAVQFNPLVKSLHPLTQLMTLLTLPYIYQILCVPIQEPCLC